MKPDPPEFLFATFDSQQLPELLRRRGAVLLREVLPPALLSHWLPAFENAFDRSDQVFEAGQMDAHTWSCFRQFGLVNPLEVTGFYLWIQELLKQPGMRQLLPNIFGLRPWLLLNDSAVRRQTPRLPQSSIRYHQDHEFLGQFVQALNVWVPLTPAGHDRPSIELWLDAPQQPLLNLTMSPRERQEICNRIPAEALWQPHLEAGDLVVFTHYTVHRTWLTPEMNQSRYSFEMRLISEAERSQASSALMACDP